MTRPPGMVAVLAQETARFSQFALDLTRLDKPALSEVRWRLGWDLAEAHNALIQQMVDDTTFEWIWFMGDDHAFSPDILTRLLDRGLDMVVPLCLMRNPPYRPVNWVTPPDVGDGDGVERLNLGDYPDGGLVEIAAAGGAGLLVRRQVFDELESPWFEAGSGIESRVGEDINFTKKARAAGFRIFCDLDTVLGHCATTVVWPVREADGWTYGFSMTGGYQITLPPKTGWALADAHA